MPSPGKEEDYQPKFDNRNDDLVRMTKAILEVGPRIGEVARCVGIHKETVRYRFRKFFVERGLVVQANLDYQRLGFRRLIIVARLADAYERHFFPIMSALSEMCYLTGFMQTTLEGLYILHVVVPAGLRDECSRLYETLHKIGIFPEMQILTFEEFRSVPMKPEYYDFSNGVWSFDWRADELSSVTLISSGKAEVEKYDYTDLLILKEFDRDASQPLMEISKRLKLTYKTLEHHYRRHVLGRGLIRRYRVVWNGSTYNQRTEKAGSMRHTYLPMAVLATGLADWQRAKLQAGFNQLPFLWFEASGPSYYAEVFVPLESYSELLKRIREISARTGVPIRLFILDYGKGLRFSIAYGLYDPERRVWRLSAADTIARFENLIVNVNNQRGGEGT